MKTSLLWLGAALLVILEAVLAADCVGVALSVIPSCAQSCFVDGAPSVGCAGTDFACQCEQEAKLYAAIEGCVAAGCPAASFQAVIDGASSVCNCAIGGSGGGGGGHGSTISGSYAVSAPPLATKPASATATTTRRTYTGSPIPSPTVPPITIATNASSGAGQVTFRLGLAGGIATILALLTAL